MGKGGSLAAATAALVLATTWVAPASAAPPLGVIGGTERVGSIDMIVGGPAGSVAKIFEEVNGRQIELRTVTPAPPALLLDVARWRCDRLERRFLVVLWLPDGTTTTDTYTTRTPSCRNRFQLQLPKRARTVEGARLTLVDRWRIGDISPKVCVAAPGSRARCRGLSLVPDQVRATRRLDLRRAGRWRVELRVAGHRIRRAIAVRASRTFVLRGAPAQLHLRLAGDSMLTNLDRALADRLGGGAQVLSDVHLGTGLAKPGFDWIARARSHVRSGQFDAVVVLLGAHDGFDMTTPAGARVTCCADPWIAEYSRRVATMMGIYMKQGGTVPIWLTVPAPADKRLLHPVAAVNAAIRQAAVRTPGAIVLNLDALLSPGFRYREVIQRGGRRIRVRADDKVHLTLAGTRLMAGLVYSELGRLDLL